jgi:CheY-like chemotaxis protein
MTSPCMARVLVVENDLKTRSQLIEVLKRPGYIIEAGQGQGPNLLEDAKIRAALFRPHVVVMDLRLLDDEYSSDRSGLDLLKEKGFSSSRCVLHSAYLNDDYRVTRDALVEARVADVVGKEESPRRLISAVEKAARDGCICRREFLLEWPPAWDEKKIIKTLFEENAEIPSGIVTDILGHLFPDARKVVIRTLKGTDHSSASIFRGRSVLFQAWTDNKEPFVIKLAPRDRTVKEVEAYSQNIQDRLVGLFYAQLRDHKLFWELGGICYRFIGSSQKDIETFSVFYQGQNSSDEIIKPLRHFFGEVWSRYYTDSREDQTDSLFVAYDSFLKLSQRLGELKNHDETLTFPGLPGRHLNPLRWVLEHKEESFLPEAKLAITHGDLHGDNLFVDEEHAWAIDFERSKLGPILRDFVELEVDIVTRLIRLPSADLQTFHNLSIILCAPDKPMEPFKFPKYDQQDDEVIRALDVIEALRSMACKITGYQNMSEYYWGLLYDTVFAVMGAEKLSQKWWRALLFASVLCTRLSQLSNEPPLA